MLRAAHQPHLGDLTVAPRDHLVADYYLDTTEPGAEHGGWVTLAVGVASASTVQANRALLMDMSVHAAHAQSHNSLLSLNAHEHIRTIGTSLNRVAHNIQIYYFAKINK